MDCARADWLARRWTALSIHFLAKQDGFLRVKKCSIKEGFNVLPRISGYNTIRILPMCSFKASEALQSFSSCYKRWCHVVFGSAIKWSLFSWVVTHDDIIIALYSSAGVGGMGGVCSPLPRDHVFPEVMCSGIFSSCLLVQLASTMVPTTGWG